MVPNTRELLPEPETPVNTVSRRFGISTLTSLRLFTRAPCTRIRSWLSATCSAPDCVSVLLVLLVFVLLVFVLLVLALLVFALLMVPPAGVLWSLVTPSVRKSDENQSGAWLSSP